MAEDFSRGTGGNRFIPANADRYALTMSIYDQLRELRDWAIETDQVLDLGKVTVTTMRIPDGRISVSVTADLKEKHATAHHRLSPS